MPRLILGLIAGLLLATSVAQAQQPSPAAGGSTSVGTNFKKMTREACALLALEAMGVKEKFIRAETTPDGNAYGYSENVAVVVISTPFRDGVHFTVVAAGRDNAETERLRIDIQKLIFESQADPPTVKQVKAENPDRKSTAPILRWGSEQRGTSNIVRHFVPAASIAMEKHGLATVTAPNVPLCIGGGSRSGAVAFVHPGPNDIGMRIYTVGVGEEPEAERLQRTIRQEVIKILFE
jgi:hypothetical protein